MLKKTLKNNIKTLRAQANLTQEELARRAHVSRKTINVIEAGNYSPSVKLALEIAAVFHVSIEQVFYLD
jgi:putative transcriptional regulator